eukprot:5443356-Prymnesium_polylepis.1
MRGGVERVRGEAWEVRVRVVWSGLVSSEAIRVPIEVKSRRECDESERERERQGVPLTREVILVTPNLAVKKEGSLRRGQEAFFRRADRHHRVRVRVDDAVDVGCGRECGSDCQLDAESLGFGVRVGGGSKRCARAWSTAWVNAARARRALKMARPTGTQPILTTSGLDGCSAPPGPTKVPSGGVPSPKRTWVCEAHSSEHWACGAHSRRSERHSGKYAALSRLHYRPPPLPVRKWASALSRSLSVAALSLLCRSSSLWCPHLDERRRGRLLEEEAPLVHEHRVRVVAHARHQALRRQVRAEPIHIHNPAAPRGAHGTPRRNERSAARYVSRARTQLLTVRAPPARADPPIRSRSSPSSCPCRGRAARPAAGSSPPGWRTPRRTARRRPSHSSSSQC